MNKKVFRLKAKCPANWDTLPFGDAIKDATGGKPKVKKGSYKQNGSLAIIDQGQELIGGYIDDESLACKEKLPCILFGDHTKIFKFIDQPFALGADGVKVLVPKGEFDKRFLYHYLNTLKLPDNAGYSRHFKFLKEKAVVKPPLADQKRIAEILDKADAIRRKRRQAIQLADEFLRSVFLDMFGDPVSNTKNRKINKIEEVGMVQGGLQLTPKRKSYPIELPYFRVANVFRNKLDLREIKTIKITEAELSRALLKNEDILIVGGHGNRAELGRSAIWDGSIKQCTHQNHLIRLRIDKKGALPKFVSTFLNSSGGKRQLLKYGKTTSGLNTISTSNVKETEIFLPPLELQNKFVDIINKIEKLKKAFMIINDQQNILLKSLSQHAFRGEL